MELTRSAGGLYACDAAAWREQMRWARWGGTDERVAVGKGVCFGCGTTEEVCECSLANER